VSARSRLCASRCQGIGPSVTSTPRNSMPEPLVSVEGLKVHFPVRSSGILRRHVADVKAVDGVDLTVYRGETLGLVGESGCGKSTTGLAILRLIEATAGRIEFDGIDVRSLSKRDLMRQRSRWAMMFQDPIASLDPWISVVEIVAEPLVVHRLDRKSVV